MLQLPQIIIDVKEKSKYTFIFLFYLHRKYMTVLSYVLKSKYNMFLVDTETCMNGTTGVEFKLEILSFTMSRRYKLIHCKNCTSYFT